MSKPNAYKMYQELASHYSIERGSKSVSEWQAAIKKAAGGEGDSVEVIYDKWKAVKPAVVVEPAKVVEIIPPAPKADKIQDVARHADSRQVIHVHSPTALPAQVIEYPPRDWHGTSMRAAAWCQTMALGVVVGVLVSKHVLRFAGF